MAFPNDCWVNYFIAVTGSIFTETLGTIPISSHSHFGITLLKCIKHFWNCKSLGSVLFVRHAMTNLDTVIGLHYTSLCLPWVWRQICRLAWSIELQLGTYLIFNHFYDNFYVPHNYTAATDAILFNFYEHYNYVPKSNWSHEAPWNTIITAE